MLDGICLCSAVHTDSPMKAFVATIDELVLQLITRCAGCDFVS